MCGIFGAVSLAKPFSADDFYFFKSLTDKVSYRGPDSSGYAGIKFSNSTNEFDTNNFNVFLGHRRLSIIDLSENGNQPFVDEELVLVFNGEIFNYVELRDELKRKGHIFRTETDTEVILKTYREYGEQGFSEFNGMWAFILVDRQKMKISVSRDRFSIKPLYYLKETDSFYFASEIKQLLPLLKIKEVNKTVLHRFINQNLLDYDSNTFFNNICKVKPRHNFSIDFNEKKFSEKDYWNFSINSISENQMIDSFRSLFEDSIRLRLRSDVEVGSLLSGGLDSSAITVVANNLTAHKIQSFSVVSDETKYSEEKFIDILIREKNVTNKKLRFNPTSMLQSMNEVLYHQDEPFGGFSVVAQYLIFKQIKEQTGIKVILSGQGSDEILMGYLKFFFFNLQQLSREQQYTEIVKQLFFSLINRTVLWQFKMAQAKRYLPGRMKTKNSLLLYDAEPENTWSFKNLIDRQVSDVENYSIPALAHFEDRNSMAFSIESRLPFLDHRLVNFLLSVPVSFKLKNGWTKYLLRQSMHELPAAIRWRRDKQGFTTPEELWMKRELKNEITESFTNSSLEKLGLINSTVLVAEYEKFCQGKSSYHYADFLRIYVAEQWAIMNFK